MMVDSGFIVESLDVPLIWRGAARSIDDKLSFWDGLIVESARTAQCTVLYTEDLQNGRTFDGLTVRNPFA
jgi:predicted nucleic acid-binding protein